MNYGHALEKNYEKNYENNLEITSHLLDWSYHAHYLSSWGSFASSFGTILLSSLLKQTKLSLKLLPF